MSRPKPVKNFEFVVTTPSQPKNASHQRLVKSHVTRGVPRRKAAAPLHSWLSQEPASNVESEQLDEQSIRAALTPAPRRVLWDLGWVNFPEPMQPQMRDDVLGFLTYIRDELYPAQICLPDSNVDSEWIGMLLSDATYLHSVLFTTASWQNARYGRASTPKAEFHHLKSLKLLQEKLSVPDEAEALSDQTVMSITLLALTAEVTGNIKEMRKHIDGLRRIIELRGGITKFKSRIVDLPVKVSRLGDLGLALRTASQPIFFRDEMVWDSYLANVPNPGSVKTVIPPFMRDMDWRLVNAWVDMRKFSDLCNLACQTKHRLSRLSFNEINVSILYRLLSLTYPDDPVAEAMRFGMIAFVATISYRGPFLSYGQVVLANLREFLTMIHTNRLEIPLTAWFWLLMVANTCGVEIPHEDQTIWLSEVIRELGLKDWEEGRRTLKTLSWIDLFHAESGRTIFEHSAAGQCISPAALVKL